MRGEHGTREGNTRGREVGKTYLAPVYPFVYLYKWYDDNRKEDLRSTRIRGELSDGNQKRTLDGIFFSKNKQLSEFTNTRKTRQIMKE